MSSKRLAHLVEAMRKQPLFRLSYEDVFRSTTDDSSASSSLSSSCSSSSSPVALEVDRSHLQRVRGLFESQSKKNMSAHVAEGRVSVVQAKGAPVDSDWIIPVASGFPEPDRLIVYAHGGGYVAGSKITSQALACDIAEACNAVVLNVSYRLAPEHPFPAALDDLYASLSWVTSQCDVERDSVVLVGDSAGASLCVSALLKAQAENSKHMPAAAVLMSPVFSLLGAGQGFVPSENSSLEVNRETDYLCPDSLPIFGALYGLHSITSVEETKAKLLTFTTGWDHPEVPDFPPMLVQAGEAEILLDDSRAFVEHARSFNVDARIEIYGHMFHAFQYLPRFVDEARQAIVSVGVFIREKTAPAPTMKIPF